MLPVTPETVLCKKAAEAVGLEPTSGKPPPVFKTGSSSGRMTSVLSISPGVGIEPTAAWFRARHGDRPQLPRNTDWIHSGAERPGRGTRISHRAIQSPGYPNLRRSPREIAVWKPIPPNSLKHGHLAARSKTRVSQSRRKERESNPQEHKRLGRVRGGFHRQLACPSVKSKLRWQESNLRHGD